MKTTPYRWARRLLALSLSGMALHACGGSEDERIRAATLSGGCTINSDCVEPLVCAFKRCHDQCEESRDCPDGQRCVASDRPFHVCQLGDEVACSYNSQCPSGQVCAVDGECRDQCTGDRDCVKGQVCSASACAEPEELDADGNLPPAENTAGLPATGQACTHDSECPEPLVCRSGACAKECLTSRDCRDGECVDSLCVADPAATPDASVPGPECVYNSDCAAGLSCLGGRCLAECVTDVDCGGSERCVSGRCERPPNVVDGGGLDASPPPASAECVYHSDCASQGPGYRCLAGACRPECQTDVDCLVGEICSSGQCVFVAPPGAPPGYGELCNVTSDCDPGLVCKPPGRCVFECLIDADCGVGFCCGSNGFCLTGSACGDGGPLVDPTPLPDLDGGACRSDLECQDGILCNGFERCISGGCQPALRTACDDDNPCTADSCDEGSGSCTHTPTGVLQDADGDGHFDIACGGTGDDCDDRNPDVHPGAAEVCDGADNNCDGRIDENGWDVVANFALPAVVGDAGAHTYPVKGRVPIAKLADGGYYVAAGANPPGATSSIDVWRLDGSLNVIDGPSVAVSAGAGAATAYELSDPGLATNGTGLSLTWLEHAPFSGTNSTDTSFGAAGANVAALGGHALGATGACCNPLGQTWSNVEGTSPTVVFNGTDYVMAWADDSTGTKTARIAKMPADGSFNGVTGSVLPVVVGSENDLEPTNDGRETRVRLAMTPTRLFAGWTRNTGNNPRYVLLDPSALSVIAGPFDLNDIGLSTSAGVYIGGMAYTGTHVILVINEFGEIHVVQVDALTGVRTDVATIPTTESQPLPSVVAVGGGFMIAYRAATRVRYAWVPDNLDAGFPFRDLEIGVAASAEATLTAMDDANVLLSWSNGSEVRLARLTCGP